MKQSDINSFPASWQSSSYQRAIWNARRRISGKESGTISEAESKVLRHMMGPLTRPDFSRWVKGDLLDPGKSWVMSQSSPRQKGPRHHGQESSSFHVIPTSGNDEANDSKEKTEMEKARLRPSSLTHEFIALSDSAQLHENEANRPIDISTAFDRFGLCNACFHRKGPHQHYQAPIRIGGGYSIYHRNEQITNEDLSWSTLKWLASPTEPQITEENTRSNSKQLTAGIGNQYSTDLYEQFLAKGGDATALEEYLESNFNPDVLTELEDSGVNTILIAEYAEMYRQHVKGLLQGNIKRQSLLTKTTGDDVDFATLFSEIESAGTDMNMLMTLLTKGRNDEEILRFEEMGGNIEILEYYCGEIKATESHEKIVDSFGRFLENDNRYQSAETFLEYVDSGGNLKKLKEFVKQRSSTNLAEHEAERERIEHCVSLFPNETVLLKNLEWFSQRDGHLHSFARLLQQLIENGGSVKALKQFAKTGFDSNFLLEISRGNTEDEKLLQTIGEEFSKDSKLLQDLAEFPDEPYVTEAYIRRGGSFPGLVKAMSEALDAPKFEQYVKAKTTEALKKFSNTGETARNGNLSTNPTATQRNSPVPASSSGVLSLHVLPRLLEKAKADLYFDKMIAAEQLWMKNEGQYILQALKQQTAEKANFVPEVDISERNMVISIFKHANSSTDETSVSSITGKRRNKLWSAPKPFEIRRSHISPTRPRSPFTQNRQLRISSLTEDNILDIQKRQRDELDFLRRSLRVEDFQKNWHFAITSPRGSVVTANSTQPENLPITMHPIPVEPVVQPKKDKISRKKQHREKMRALKQENRSGKSSRQSSPISERSLSPNTLQLPNITPNSVQERISLPEITVTSQDAIARSSEHESKETECTTEESDAERNRSTTSSPQLRIGLVADSNFAKTSRAETAIPETQVRYATAFGQKVASASFSNISSARELKKLMHHPETMVEVVKTNSKITSKSESAIPSSAPILQPSNTLSWEELSGKILAKKVALGSSTPARHVSESESSSDDENDDEEEIDILQRYCIVRENRVPLYKRIFEKYVLVKSIRDRENKLAAKRAKSREHPNVEDETQFEDFAQAGSAKFELGKTRFILEKIKDNIEDTQMQIVTTKGDVISTVAQVARRKYANVIDADKERKEKLKLKHRQPVFGGKSPTLQKGKSTEPETNGDKSFTDQEVVALLSPQMRLQCEAQVEVRDRKVALIHLRDKVKRLKSRQRSLHALCKRLEKQIEYEEVSKCMKRREMEPFTRKQSAIFRELHPTDDPAIDECDLRQALAELDPALEFVDNSQILEGISIDEGITFRVFCVIAALHEKRNLPRFSRSLHEKMKACKDHYASLLGRNFDLVNLDLAAVGISGPQRQRIIQKLSRGGDGGLDILDFVTYVPLFVDIHEKIVANPLPFTS